MAHSVGTVVGCMIPILVLNPCETDVYIRKQTTVGKFHPLSDNDSVIPIESQSLLMINDASAVSDIPVNINGDNLSDHEVASLKRLIHEHASAFATSKSDVGRTDVITHEIELEDGQRPRRSAPFRANPFERDIIKQEIDTCLQSGVIRPSKSAWSSPVVLVKKPDGSYRFCID